MSRLTQDQLHELAKSLGSVSVADLVKQAGVPAEPKLLHVLERAREFVADPSSYSEVERGHLLDGLTRLIISNKP